MFHLLRHNREISMTKNKVYVNSRHT